MSCGVFSNTSPQQQQSLIQSYPSRYLLSLSTNNPACEIGSIFVFTIENHFLRLKLIWMH